MCHYSLLTFASSAAALSLQGKLFGQPNAVAKLTPRKFADVLDHMRRVKYQFIFLCPSCLPQNYYNRISAYATISIASFVFLSQYLFCKDYTTIVFGQEISNIEWNWPNGSTSLRCHLFDFAISLKLYKYFNPMAQWWLSITNLDTAKGVLFFVSGFGDCSTHSTNFNKCESSAEIWTITVLIVPMGVDQKQLEE